MLSVKQIKADILPIFKKHSIKKALLFGSFARGTANNKSDIDILIETTRPFTIFDILRMEDEIKKKTSRKADLVEICAVKASLRDYIFKDAIPIL